MNHDYLTMTITLPIVPGDAEGSLWNVCQAAVAVSIVHQDSCHREVNGNLEPCSHAIGIIGINKDYRWIQWRTEITKVFGMFMFSSS